ncbi:MAG TPA: molybdopterin molybdotransferase MoeA [Pseudonocardiaceae bacterium]|nr:molybdopterin molybdotransferase MoeA [Pseudonocardiaceae bacterium]
MIVLTTAMNRTVPLHSADPVDRRRPVPVPWEQARVRAHAAPQPLGACCVPLTCAAGLTLAGEICTRVPLPAFDTAAMDGYAVAGPGPWQLRGQVWAGAVWKEILGPGEAVEICTGAQVPLGARAVLPVELAVFDGAFVSGAVPAAGTHIRRAGEDAPAGTPLAPTGTRIGPALIGLAATCGYDTLPVRPRPQVRILVTGEELTHTGTSGAGRVRDALGPLLPTLVAQLGGEVREVRHLPDRLTDLLGAAVHPPDEGGDAEVVVVTGSTSVGVTDQLRQLLRTHGARWIVDTVACRPGHPQLLAGLGTRRWLVGLPGNPFAAFVAAYTLLGPLLAGLSGRRLPELPLALVTGDVRPAPGLTRLVPVAWEGGAARVVGGHRAAFLRGAALGDALAAVPPGWTDGTPVPLVLTG